MSDNLYIQKQAIKSLEDFYMLMSATGKIRSQVLAYLLEGKQNKALGYVQDLENALFSLEQIPGDGSDCKTCKILTLPALQKVSVDLSYEISELEKDIFFLQKTEQEFLAQLQKNCPGFEQEVSTGIEFLKNKHFKCFITDRDGTVNNYCGRYRSSIQSIYNGLFLTRFVQKHAQCPIIVTSGPLQGPGILDVSITAQGAFVYAGSKGREFMDLKGRIHRCPIEEDKQQILNELNARLRAKVEEPGFEKFALIGSGLQFKFGQTTIARQDVSKSVDAGESEQFLKTVSKLVQELDPGGENLRIEDTGLDIEIILTVSTKQGLKDFDKGDAVNYLNKALDLNMQNKEHLVCGDTLSDLPMLTATLEHSDKVCAIFVTKDPDLSSKVSQICPDSLIVTSPDVLVTILGQLP